LPLTELSKNGIEVHAISHVRRAQISAGTAREYLQEAVAYIRRWPERPCALFGHSLGGLFAWRIAHELPSEAAPILLGVSGIDPAGRGAALTDADIEATFASVFGAGSGRPTDNVRHDFIADMQLWRAMPKVATTAAKLAMPLAAFLGRRDHVVNQQQMWGWSEATTGDFSLSSLPGDHFCLSQAASQRSLVSELGWRIQARSAPGVGAARDAGDALPSPSLG
jgi:surfactin synthase thioesterase subunit